MSNFTHIPNKRTVAFSLKSCSWIDCDRDPNGDYRRRRDNTTQEYSGYQSDFGKYTRMNSCSSSAEALDSLTITDVQSVLSSGRTADVDVVYTNDEKTAIKTTKTHAKTIVLRLRRQSTSVIRCWRLFRTPLESAAFSTVLATSKIVHQKESVDVGGIRRPKNDFKITAWRLTVFVGVDIKHEPITRSVHEIWPKQRKQRFWARATNAKQQACGTYDINTICPDCVLSAMYPGKLTRVLALTHAATRVMRPDENNSSLHENRQWTESAQVA